MLLLPLLALPMTVTPAVPTSGDLTESSQMNTQLKQAGTVITDALNREGSCTINDTLNPLQVASLSGFVSVSATPYCQSYLLQAGILRVLEYTGNKSQHPFPSAGKVFGESNKMTGRALQ